MLKKWRFTAGSFVNSSGAFLKNLVFVFFSFFSVKNLSILLIPFSSVNTSVSSSTPVVGFGLLYVALTSACTLYTTFLPAKKPGNLKANFAFLIALKISVSSVTFWIASSPLPKTWTILAIVFSVNISSVLSGSADI